MFFKKPKIEEKVNVYSQGATIEDFLRAEFFSRDYKSFAREGYTTNVICNRCIQMISNGVAKVELQFLKGENILEKHDLKTLLEKPNPFQSYTEFTKSVISHLLIAGNAYIISSPFDNKQNNKLPIHLRVLNPNEVSVEDTGTILKYIVNNKVYIYNYADIKSIPPILHIKTFNPLSEIQGLSQIEPSAYAVDQHNKAGEWNMALLQNYGKPSGALKTPDKLTEEQFNNLKTSLEENYSSAKNAGRPMLLEGGLEWIQMGLSPSDMDFMNLKNSNSRDIALAFGVPSQLLGIPGDNTYSNMAEARLDFFENTVIPILENWTDKLNNWLNHLYPDIKIIYNKDDIGELASRRETQISTVLNLKNAGVATINEVRDVAQLPAYDIPEADMLFTDFNKIPLGEEIMPDIDDSSDITDLAKLAYGDNQFKK